MGNNFRAGKEKPDNSNYLQTPQVPPFLAQCLQYLQFLQALHDLLPVQVAYFSVLK